MDRTGGGPDAYHHLRKIAEYRAAGAYHCAFADRNAGSDEYIGGQPHFVFNDDGECLNIEAWGPVIVGARAQITFLRYHDVVADGNFCEAIQDGVIAHPRIVADF